MNGVLESLSKEIEDVTKNQVDILQMKKLLWLIKTDKLNRWTQCQNESDRGKSQWT